jgi:PAS domain S-box-containing protein
MIMKSSSPHSPARLRSKGRKPTNDRLSSSMTMAAPAGRRLHSLPILSLLDEQRENLILLKLQNDQLREVQSELELTRQRYADLYELAPVGYATFDASGCIREINQTAARLLGVAASSLLWKPFVRRVVPEDRQEFLALLWQCRRSNAPLVKVFGVQSGDGTTCQVQCVITLAPEPGPEGACYHVALLDITKQHEVQLALRRSEAKFGLLAENSTEVFWFLNLDPLHFTYISPAFERIWGFPVEEMLADHTRWIQSVHPEDRASVTRQFYDWVEGAAESFVCDYRIIGRDDEVRWISTRGSALPTQPGQPRQLGGVARDISHRKKTEEELRQSGRFALSTLEAVPAGLAVLDEEGMILSSNESWNTLVLAGAGSFHHCAPGTNYLQACAEVAVDGGDAPLRLADGIRDVINGLRTRFVMEFSAGVGGDRRWFVTHVTVMRGDGPRRVVVAHLDITLRKQAEKGIRRMNDELERRVGERTRELQAANDVLQREMAARLRLEEEILEISESERQRIGQDLHDDLGQQVAGAVFLSQALARELTLLSSPAAQSASRLMETLQRALDLTRTLARGLHPVAMEVGGLSHALSELVEKTSQLFGNHCEFSCPQPVSDLDNTQATHLYRIAQESVTNAVKHGQASHIAVSLTETPLTLVLTIRDNGTGLSHPAPKAEGMGLRIMRYRADIIGGNLTLASPPSGGTTVTCTLHRPLKSNSTNH